VPRDIDSNISKFGCVSLFNIDDLNKQVSRNRNKRQSEVPKAEKIVVESTDKFAQWYQSLDIVPVISRLTEKNLQLAHNEARRYANQFGEANSTKLERFAESLVKKVLHGPINFLKNGGDEDPSTEQLEAADLVNKMFLSEGKRDR
jgi:glutamyl-tRNA reductase